MKLKQALKKFDFLKRLKIGIKVTIKVISNLSLIIKGSDNKYMTPIAVDPSPIELLVAWDYVFEENKHKLNAQLLEMEQNQRNKFGPRSVMIPWADRKQSLLSSFSSQTPNFNPDFHHFNDAPGNLCPITESEVIMKIKVNTSAGFPYLTTKGKALKPKEEGEIPMLDNYDEILDRDDPCMLYTRTAESKKTRNVWGYPIAKIFYEMYFFFPFLDYMKTKFWQASIVSPVLVDTRITAMIKEAIRTGKVLYSVDFVAFDTSCSWQLIIKAFDVIKSCYAPCFGEFIDKICLWFYTIPIVTPTGILRGNHGVPSGSSFTNVIDSLIQAGSALTLDFIEECWMIINGDDGVYMMYSDRVGEFEQMWKKQRLNLGKDKVLISNVSCTFCQRLYHIDYIKDDFIGGVYPVYRALNRLIWLEKFTNLRKIGITSRDHFGIRTLTILEQCKYHPLFEELVRFVLHREKFALDVSKTGTVKYLQELTKGRELLDQLNETHLVSSTGIKEFESYKLVQRIIAEEGYADIVDLEALAKPQYDEEL